MSIKKFGDGKLRVLDNQLTDPEPESKEIPPDVSTKEKDDDSKH